MELAKRQIGDRLDVAVKGRLDAYWAEHLARLLAEAIGGGTRHLRLDLGEVDYLSSAGIRVLLQYYKQLKGGRGSFLVSATSAPVKTVLALVGLEELLGGKGEPSPSRSGGVGESDEQSRVTLLDRGAARFEVFAGSPFASLSCRAIGDPGLLSGGLCARRTQSLPMQFPQGAFAVGLGALGYDFQDCRDRFGEFLAVAGALVYRPTGMRPVPDYQLQAGA
ncbi:MAG: anti-sigma factor antagonist, partial [Nitrospirae bacterium]